MSKEKYKVVVVDHTFEPLDVEENELQGFGIELISAQCKWDDEQEIIEAAKDAHAIIVQNSIITRKVIESLKKCRVIALYGVGLDPVDVEAATEHGIIVANVPDYCINEVADHTMALVLGSLRKVVRETIAIRRLNPNKGSGSMNYGGPLFGPIFKLKGQVLGLVGFGNVSRNLVSKARPFRFDIIAYDPIVDKKLFSDHNVTQVSLDEILRNSDIVSLHLPLNEKTENLIGAAELAKMKKTAFLINTSRGPIVDEDALYKALKENRIAGAGIDATVNEPINPDNPLLELDNLIITNHIGYYSEGCVEDVRAKAAREVCSVLSGKEPRSIAFVNPQVRGRKS